jgi:hypothetical protein
MRPYTDIIHVEVARASQAGVGRAVQLLVAFVVWWSHVRWTCFYLAKRCQPKVEHAPAHATQ